MGEATVRRFTYAVKFFSSLFQLQNKTISSSLSTFHVCLTVSVSPPVVSFRTRSTLSSIS